MLGDVRIGLISDTHGLLRPSALLALDGVDLILHAGDVGGMGILHELERFAPVHAVHGNTDDPALGLPAVVSLTLGVIRIHVSHGHELGSPTPIRLAARYATDVIIYGHTHRPLIERVANLRSTSTLVVNPGAAGPRRFNLRPSVAILQLGGATPAAEILTIDG
jgi:uncharacterized protein